MRVFVLVGVLAARLAAAQAISGTLSATFKEFNRFGVPTVTVGVNLQCSLTCGPSAPTLTYRVTGLFNSVFAAEPTTNTGYIGVGFATSFASTGQAMSDNDSMPSGANVRVTGSGATCHCGNAVGQGGYIDVSDEVSIPPFVQVPESAKTGAEQMLFINAAPRGAEVVTIAVSGGGLSFNRSFSSTEFRNGSTSTASVVQIVRVTPTQPGTVTATVALVPGATFTSTFEVTGAPIGAGGGGGGSAATGGGAGGGGGGGGDAEPTQPTSGGGCTAAPGALVAVALWLARRRTRR